MIGYCFCGSFCTVPKSIKILRSLVLEGNPILPIMNESVYTTDTRFGTAADTVRTVEEICSHKVLHTIVETEPIGPSLVLDMLVIAPCTGNTLAKIAHGIGDDALSTCVLANKSQLLVAPAMNPAMWNNPAVQANVAILKERGVLFAGPVCGHVACGADGTGRMVEASEILEEILEILGIEK